MPYLSKLANNGFVDSIKKDAGFAKGVNTFKGHITYKPVAEGLDLIARFKELRELM